MDKQRLLKDQFLSGVFKIRDNRTILTLRRFYFFQNMLVCHSTVGMCEVHINNDLEQVTSYFNTTHVSCAT